MQQGIARLKKSLLSLLVAFKIKFIKALRWIEAALIEICSN